MEASLHLGGSLVGAHLQADGGLVYWVVHAYLGIEQMASRPV